MHTTTGVAEGVVSSDSSMALGLKDSSALLTPALLYSHLHPGLLGRLVRRGAKCRLAKLDRQLAFGLRRVFEVEGLPWIEDHRRRLHGRLRRGQRHPIPRHHPPLDRFIAIEELELGGNVPG